MTYESGYRVNAPGRDVVEGLLSGRKAALGATIVGAGVKGAVGGWGVGILGVPTGGTVVVLRDFFCLALLMRFFTFALSFAFLDFLLPPLRKL
jgi:hypothetical protein